MKNVPDELLPTLRGAPGDLPLPGSSRWGKTLRLQTRATPTGSDPRNGITFIQTEVFQVITPMAVQLRFSLDGQTFTPDVPAAFGGTVRVEVIQTIDMKTGPFRETWTLSPGDRQPICGLICLALNVSIALVGENVFLYVQAVAAPTSNVDCADIIGPTPAPLPPPFPTATQARYPQDASTTWPNFALISAALPTRQQWMIQNNSPDDLLVSMNAGANFGSGTEFGAMVLPGGIAAIYESSIRYTGPLSITWRAGGSGGGYALLTQVVGS